MHYLQSQYLSISEDPGVYLLKNRKGEVIYVGKASNLKKRVASYFQSTTNHDSKTNLLISQVNSIEVIASISEIEAFLLEASLIKKYDPKFNVRLTDGKSYIYIKITVNEDMPKVLFVRKISDSKSMYFGPFPSFTTLKKVLKLIRRIFPYQSASHQGKRICLYNHLRLCPCPATISTPELKKHYRKNIFRITRFLNGRVKDVISDLEKERDLDSESLNFENASLLQNKIDDIRTITSPFYKPFEFEKNPDLKNEVRAREVSSLRDYLNNFGVNVKELKRIECFDVSNTSGTNATGSMVTFINGEKDSSLYRHFKIKKPPKKIPNDFEMMKEVIRRRLNHLSDWGTPDLIIVDGGKGHVSVARSVLLEKGENIPVIGLAKKEEKIVTGDFRILLLPRSSESLNLIRRIRDEAHRFAVNYHKKLRSRAIYV